jgi:NAD+ synthase
MHANIISEWIENQAKEASATSLVVGVSGGVDSALVAALCSRTSLKVIGVVMPCHSSSSSIKRAMDVVQKFGVTFHKVELEKAFDSITSQLPYADDVKFCHGALRSCLRAPTLDYIAKLYNGIIVGTGNKDEDEVTRYYQKRGDGAVDISPIAKLHKSQVYALASELGVPESVLNARPSADLWGGEEHDDEEELGMTYDEIEKGIRTAQAFTNDENINDSHLVLAASSAKGRDRDVLLKLAEMEKRSRHKINIPVLKIN